MNTRSDEFGKLMKCPVCGRMAFNFFMPDYKYTCLDMMRCGVCAMYAENIFVENMEIEELPLWVGYKWLFSSTQYDFERRLKLGH